MPVSARRKTTSAKEKAASTVETAWPVVRGGFVELLERVAASDFPGADEIKILQGAQTLRGKTAFVYYPEQLLPIYAKPHLDHFASLFGVDLSNAGVLVTNQRVKQAILQRTQELASWDPFEIAFLLYDWSNPQPPAHKVYKIAPGESAKYWDDCRSGGYMCVGWDLVGDLSQYESNEEFVERFAKEYPHSGNKGAITRKSRELWTLRELQVGDVIVANRGTSTVVGIGEVVEPGYQWMPEREEFRHTVAVRWNDVTERAIETVPQWAFKTVLTLSNAKYEKVLAGIGLAEKGDADEATPLFNRLAAALDHKRQVILFGPPGTGKTYHARRFVDRWLTERTGAGLSPTAGDVPAMKSSNNTPALGEPRPTGPQMRFVTFHPSYTYEDFVEGYRPVESDGDSDGLRLSLRAGVFSEICADAETDPGRPYVLIIDEINRGNLPKIFGELITLLEVDKRAMPGAAGEQSLKVVLPQSGRLFGVPDNVYLVGTMNTADRSIRLLDAAFRRRFAFVELMPDPELLAGARIEPLDLDVFLTELNNRIRAKHGREKQVGHSYLLPGGIPVSSAADFARIMRIEIVPLLQEYAYDDYVEVAHYLGPKIVNVSDQLINEEIFDDPDALVAAIAEHLGSDKP